MPTALLINLKKSNWVTILIGIYGLVFFVFNNYYDYIPKAFINVYFPLYTYLEYLVFSAILWVNIPKKNIRILIILFSVLFLVFQVVYLFTSKLQKLDTVPIGIETILIFIYVFLFLHAFFTKNIAEYIYNNYCFWICIGLLIYLGGSFFLNILANHVSNISDYWYLTFIAETIKNILFAIAVFILAKSNLKTKNSSQPSTPFLDMN